MAPRTFSSRPPRWSWADSLNVLLIGVATSLVFAGFWDPDPFYFEGPNAHVARKVLNLLRAATIAVGASAALLYYLTKTGKIGKPELLMAAVGAAAACLFLYPVAAFLHYDYGFRNRLASYHPFLQLVPPDLGGTGPKSSGTVRIICVGGSTTAWPDKSGVSWQSRVAASLTDAGLGPVEVLNAGKEWYTTAHTLINYDLNLRHLGADLVVAMHGINDLLLNADFSYLSHGPFAEDYRHFFGPLDDLLGRGSTFQSARTFLRSTWYPRPRKVIDVAEFPGLVPFRRNTETLIDHARLAGADVVLMTEANLYDGAMTPEEIASLHMLHKEAVGPDTRWSLATAHAGMKRYNDVTRSVANERGLAVVDLDAAVPKETRYFSDDVHFTDAAHPLVAAEISRVLADVVREYRAVGGGER